MRTFKSLAFLPSALALALPVAGIADTVLPRTQTFTVSAQIVAGCGVVGGGSGTGLDFGTLDFGTHPAIATGQANATTGGSALQIECSPGTTLKMTVDGGIHPTLGNTQRNLANAGSRLIAYRLYADASRTNALAVGQAVSIAVSGTVSLPIYGALTLPGGNTPAGTYIDTAQVTLSY
ncbi:spore coat U domain-containing protein [Burkholderia sp. Ac-20353]|uniref:Csu type fimbrial protein n=1 Tax=Burkholderia sp. Ac-20353 TaxID=2703894 RepID=UPI00197C7637|nr:spore coat U domain-containing protein [Burkholderia sp. Ac-20353]MBN3787164.1 spore coat protein U domain-containing protein [Burkholderia sp. Ac-20353]